MESFELLLNCAMTGDSSSQVDISEDDLIDIRNQFSKLKSCDPYLLLNNLRRHSKSGKLTTIVHGELWDRNVLMLDDDKVKILDWKNAKLASATLDLAFLMLTSTTSDVRSCYTNDLLRSYHKVFCQTMDKFGIPSQEQPSFCEILEDYQISLQVAILQVSHTFIIFLPDNVIMRLSWPHCLPYPHLFGNRAISKQYRQTSKKSRHHKIMRKIITA